MELFVNYEFKTRLDDHQTLTDNEHYTFKDKINTGFMVTVTTDKDNYGKNEDVHATITVEKRITGEDTIHVGVYDSCGNQISPWHYISFDSPNSNVATWDIWMQCFNTPDTLYDIQGLYGQEPPGNKKIHHADHNQ